MPEFTTNIQKLAKVEFLSAGARLAIDDLPEVGDSLLIVNVPWGVAAPVNDAKLITSAQDVLIELYIRTREPEKKDGNDFYVAEYDNRLEIRS